MGSLDDFNALAPRLVAVPGHYHSGEVSRPVLLDHARHFGGCLAGAYHQRPTAGRRRQMRRQAMDRLRCVHCRIEHLP
jgi:hypothetical protein